MGTILDSVSFIYFADARFEVTESGLSLYSGAEVCDRVKADFRSIDDCFFESSSKLAILPFLIYEGVDLNRYNQG